jgi:UDP-2,3-diacylglucosamine pyrophosphatase LpxH
MRILNFIMIVMLISVFTSCKKSSDSPGTSGIDPFSNGSSERNMIVVLSDMHMGADTSYTECKRNIAPLVKLLQQIEAAPNVKELVIAGDLIDEWFVPATENTYQGKDQSDFVQRVKTANKSVFDALNQIIQEKKIKVTYVPGNHDLAITAASVELILPGVNQARDDQQGDGTYTPSDFSVLAIEHGHRYNFACAPDPISNQDIAPGAIMPPGYFFTRIAALCVKENFKPAGSPLPVVTRNTSGGTSQDLAFDYYEGWVSLMKMFPILEKSSDQVIVTNINGYTKNYSINDLMPFQLTLGGPIDMKLFKGIQDTWEQRQNLNHVAIHIPVKEAIANQDSNLITDNMANVQYFKNPNSTVRIVVFGHTHVAKIMPFTNNGKKSIYANSGTWIDSNPSPLTMNFVVITPQNSVVTSQTYVKLYNVEDNVIKPMAADSLRY